MDPVNPEFTITVLEARIKSLSSELEQMTKHANEGWALANTRTAQSKSIELQNDGLKKLLKRFTDLDCCTGFALSENEHPKLWDALEDARELLTPTQKRKEECSCIDFPQTDQGGMVCSKCGR